MKLETAHGSWEALVIMAIALSAAALAFSQEAEECSAPNDLPDLVKEHMQRCCCRGYQVAVTEEASFQAFLDVVESQKHPSPLLPQPSIYFVVDEPSSELADGELGPSQRA